MIALSVSVFCAGVASGICLAQILFYIWFFRGQT